METIESLMDRVNQSIRESAALKLMNLGELINALESVDDKSKGIRMDFSYEGPGDLGSYRGYYAQLCFHGLTRRTVQEVLYNAKAAVGAEFCGWKGGDYTMGLDTPVWWASSRGECHDTGVIGVTDNGYQVIIHTAYVDL